MELNTSLQEQVLTNVQTEAYSYIDLCYIYVIYIFFVCYANWFQGKNPFNKEIEFLCTSQLF